MQTRLNQMFLACVTTAVIFISAHAQENTLSGTLNGTVLGASGKPTSFARIQLQGQAVYAAVSDVNGTFKIANFKTGTYLVNIRQNNNVQNLTQSIPGLTVTLSVKW